MPAKRNEPSMPMWTAVLAVVLSTGAPVATGIGCSSSSESQGSPASGTSSLEVLFPKMYSAYDGTHTFKLPAVVDGVTGVVWSASDTSMVDLDPQADESVMITVRKAGTVTIKATAGGLTGSAPLTITQATTEDWQAGSERYNNGTVLEFPSPDSPPPDGGPREPRTIDTQLSCTNCHGSGSGSADIQHTPTQTAGYSDDELVTIFTEGKKPAGAKQRVMPVEQWSQIHKWSMPEQARKGIVVYLRSLEPKEQGDVDFGGRRPPIGGGASPADGGS